MTIKHGEYLAAPLPQTHAWQITRQGVAVGKMFFGGAYPNRYRCSLTELVWSGPLPDGCESPKSPHYGIHFDGEPHAKAEEALADFAQRADRLIAWRAEHARARKEV